MDPLPTGNDLLNETLRLGALWRKPRKPAAALSHLAGKDLSGKIAAHLTTRNVLRVDGKRYLGVIPFEAAPQQNASAKYWVKQRLRSVVLAGETPDVQDIAFLSLLQASALNNLVFTRDERRAADWQLEKMFSVISLDPQTADGLGEILTALAAATSAASLK